jgi:hypothetical protein
VTLIHCTGHEARVERMLTLGFEDFEPPSRQEARDLFRDEDRRAAEDRRRGADSPEARAERLAALADGADF